MLLLFFVAASATIKVTLREIRSTNNNVSPHVHSGIQYEDAPIQLEQSQAKADQSSYTDVAARPGKSRPSSRSKCRRAPYSPAAVGTAPIDRPAEYSTGYPERAACDYDAEMSLQSLYNMGRAAAYQGLAPEAGSGKYGEVYGHTPSTPTLCSSDPVAMYQSYAGHQRYCDERTSAYRGRYDDLFYHAPREHSYPTLYMSSSLGDELRGVGSSDSASDSLNVSSCILQQAASCSRSSSREDCCVGHQEATTSHLQAQYQLAAYSSNRSESSASDVDVVSEEHHTHARCMTDMRSAANMDGLEEATRLAQRRLYEAARTLSAGETTKENAHEHHPSVIMCRQTAMDEVVVAKANGRSDEQTAVRHSKTSCAGQADTGHSDSLYGSTQLTYDGYKPCLPSFQHDLQSGHRASYSVITQPGYTSVIVDTQQYQLANGFVH